VSAFMCARVCMRVGWLELDLIMGTWADENLQQLSIEQLEQVRPLTITLLAAVRADEASSADA